MTNRTLGLWLLVALATVGVAFAAPAGAHGDEPTHENARPADQVPVDGTVADWSTWMNEHMFDHMGPDGSAAIGEHMGVNVDEPPHNIADEDYRSAGIRGQGHGC